MLKKEQPCSRLSLLFVLITALAVSGAASGDPPPWAPAHGHKKHHRHGDHKDDGDEHYRRERTGDFGILSGHCNRQAVVTVLGGALGGTIGGAVGSQSGDGSGQMIGIVAGTIIGAVLGNTIGREMDRADRFCAGQTLEYAQDRTPVRWMSADRRVSYVVTPTRTFHDRHGYCREFITELGYNSAADKLTRKACRRQDGNWAIMD